MFFRSCTFTCFLVNAYVNVNKFAFPLSSTHFRNNFSSNSYENITFSIQNTHAHINLILLSRLIKTLDCTSIFIYPISALRSIWISNNNIGFSHNIHMDTAISKNNYAISTCSNRMELYGKKVYPFTQRTHHVESTSIRRGYYVDTLKTKFRRVSTSFPHTFFGVISMVNKSTSFPRTFFDVILMAEKSTSFPHTFSM